MNEFYNVQTADYQFIINFFFCIFSSFVWEDVSFPKNSTPQHCWWLTFFFFLIFVTSLWPEIMSNLFIVSQSKLLLFFLLF